MAAVGRFSRSQFGRNRPIEGIRPTDGNDHNRASAAILSSLWTRGYVPGLSQKYPFTIKHEMTSEVYDAYSFNLATIKSDEKARFLPCTIGLVAP